MTSMGHVPYMRHFFVYSVKSIITIGLVWEAMDG